ncbi:isoprenyl transferase [Cellulomonas sp. URHD0024]|uniref:isoprenyl transferase n=1 Tax=Cellulomonas sp. URHD0024 TaxID=1302620 RepID=UPI000429EFD4|nr:isoprenyl transferase [Cellulomonas sp. URHD0024]
MRLPHPLYGLYERRLAASIPPAGIPRHVGVILDGNRRWARSQGGSTAHGHRAGGDKIADLLEWSEDIGVEVVTLWLLSTDNLERSPDELEPLLAIIEDVVGELAATGRWRVQAVGALDMLPDHTSKALVAAQDATAGIVGLHVNVAVGYGGRREIADAVRAFLREHAEAGSSLDELAEDFDMEHIAERLYTRGQPDPELVIRTSGEQRLGGFLLWQSAHSEFYFCEAYWPDFRRIDFLRAVRAYAARERRLGR